VSDNSKLVFVCVGAGQSSRFGGDKLVQTLGEKTVFAAALEALESACPAADMVVVVAPEKIDFWRHRLAGQFPRARFAAGAEHRHGSVRAGVTAAVGLGAEIVAIHDAARPLVDPRDVQNLVRGLGDADGAILTGKVTDTVKRIDRDGVVVETVDRQNLGFALTPQVFRVSSLQAAWRKTGNDGDWTDESAILESAGMQVRSVVARYPNPKLTSPPDLELIRALAGVPS
jgi:2-C-methyl-D-erythritol 4-phosphate cytidylyltransferase